MKGLENLNIRKLGKTILRTSKAKAPTIMSFGAVIGLGSTVYLALKAKPKADEILEERKQKLEELEQKRNFEEEHVKESEAMDEKTYKEERRSINIHTAVKLASVIWKPIAAGLVTTGLILGANHINVKRLALLGAAYELKNNELSKYKEKAKEALNGKGDIERLIGQEKIDETWTDDTDVIETGLGNQLYMDAYSGRYFRASRTAIDNARNQINHFLNSGDFMPINEFYRELRLAPIEAGREAGWNGGDKMLDINYSYGEMPDGTHCVVVHFDWDIRKDSWGDREDRWREHRY